MSLRGLAEHWSRGIVLRRRLPPEFSGLPIYVSPECGLRYWRWNIGKVDPMLCRMARELVSSGSTVWDIGANVGLFAFCAAALAGPAGQVLAVEPDLWLAQLLTRSSRDLRRNHQPAASVNVLAAAVSESNRVGLLSIAERARASNHLIESQGSTQVGGTRGVQSTVTVSLDFLADYFPAPTVLKIDVEGAEVGVLRGASRLLQSSRPVIWCEVHPENSSVVADLLLANRYQIYAAALSPADRVPLHRASWDTLAIPLP
jgi:FkbM family methyltransferase